MGTSRGSDRRKTHRGPVAGPRKANVRMRQWPRVRGIITWHPYLFTPPAYRPRGRTPGDPPGRLSRVQLGVNVPNFGPGTDPDVLRRWALTVEGLGFDLLMVSDHVAVTPDVAEQYPAPFYEPFTTLAWLAGLTRRIRLGTTVLILPYRHPLLTARMAANLNDLSGGRLGPAGVRRARCPVPRARTADRPAPAGHARRVGRCRGLPWRAGPGLDRRQQRRRAAPGRPPGRRLAPAPVHARLADRGPGPDEGHRSRAGPAATRAGAADRAAPHLVAGRRR